MTDAYENLKKHVSRKGFGPDCHSHLNRMVLEARDILSGCRRIELSSLVPGKTYHAYVGASDMNSRPLNSGLFSPDIERSLEDFGAVLTRQHGSLGADEITSAIYTVAITCCAAIDVTKRSDRKTQGTIFEWICAAIMRAVLDVEPSRSLEVLNLDLKGRLPTDFVFDLGSEKPKFHLPVKTSTRERILQVWAHQRVLDGAYGVGRFLAMPIILAETKLDAKTLQVIEICLPWQWRLYQMHVARLWNVCYLDAPSKYLALNDVFPPVRVKTLGDALACGGAIPSLLNAHGLA